LVALRPRDRALLGAPLPFGEKEKERSGARARKIQRAA
jgi:hypothetical protein